MLVHQSSTRRKSCSGCVRAKRRCDLRLPSCSRCQKRDLNCSFARILEKKNSPEAVQVEAPTNPRKRDETAETSFQIRPSPLPPGGGPSSSAAGFDTFKFENDGVTNPGDLIFDNHNLEDLQNLQNLDQYFTNLSGAPAINQAVYVQPHLGIDFRDTGSSTCNSSTTTPIWRSSTESYIPPSLPPTAIIRQSQLQREVHHLQSCIPSLVSTGHAPFIHDIFNERCPLGSLRNRTVQQDLLTVCSLQACRNPQNKSAINSVVNSKANSLIASSLKDRAFLNLLESVQALIVYQIIRLFDDDAEQRAIAEHQSLYLYSWTSKLQTHHSPYRNYIPTNLTPYQEYITSESVRRTIVTSILLKYCYSTFKFGACEDISPLQRQKLCGRESFWKSGEYEWNERLKIDGAEPTTFPYKKFVEEWTTQSNGDMDVVRGMVGMGC